MEKEKITFKEWVVCLSFLFCIGSLFFVSLPLEGRFLYEFAEESERQEKMKVHVSGAVLRPGDYEVRVGSSLKSVVDRAGLESLADKKALYSKKILVNSCEIFVPEKLEKKKRRNNRLNQSK